MNFPPDSFASSSESTARLINKLHSMPWLKRQNSSNLQKEKMSRAGVNTVERSFRSKKTDEDYFSGTRGAKKEKRNKKKKDKPVLVIHNLNDLTRAFGNEVNSQSDSRRELPNVVCEEKNGAFKIAPPDLPVAVNLANTNIVWSTNTKVAEVLFPNVQSVRIDRMEEEEMLSRALAESIATVQLEQFKRNSPVKENSWDALYGDDDDDSGGWDNIRRNLPVETESKIPERIARDRRRRRSCDNNNNSSKSGILRKKEDDERRSVLSCKNLDFSFKKSSENGEEEVERVLPTKSVSFGESVTVGIACDEPSEDYDGESKRSSNEAPKVSGGARGNGEPVIDKFGRVNGYSERRIFMGKGARMREQLYIQSMCGIESTEKDAQAIPTTAKSTIKATVEGAKRSQLKSHAEKPFLEKNSLDQNFTVSSSTETIGEANSCEKYFDDTTKITSSFVETNDKPQDQNFNVTRPFYMLNTDKNWTEKRDLVAQNSDSVRDAPESQILLKMRRDEADLSTSTSEKQEGYVPEFRSENPQYANEPSVVTGMMLPPPIYQGLYPPRLSCLDQYFPASNIAFENLNPTDYHRNLNNITKWQSHQSIAAYHSPSNYNCNSGFVAGYPNDPNHPQMPYSDRPYLVNHATPQFSAYSSGMDLVNHHCGTLSMCEEARRSGGSLPTMDHTELLPSADVIGENNSNRFATSAQPWPGFVKVAQLPPGFAKRKFVQRSSNNCENNCGRTISPDATQRVTNSFFLRSEKTPNEGSAPEIKAPFQQICAETIPGHFQGGISPGFYKQYSNYTEDRQASDESSKSDVNTADSKWLQPRLISGYSALVPNRCQRLETAVGSLAQNCITETNKRAIGNAFGDVKVAKGRGRLTERDLM